MVMSENGKFAWSDQHESLTADGMKLRATGLDARGRDSAEGRCRAGEACEDENGGDEQG